MKRSILHRPAHWLLALSVALSLWLPGLAQACSVCSTGREDENRLAFILSTAFMSILPLVLAGGVILWLRALAKRSQDADQQAALARLGGRAEEHRHSAPVTPITQ